MLSLVPFMLLLSFVIPILQQCFGGFLIVIGLVFVVYSNRVVSCGMLLIHIATMNFTGGEACIRGDTTQKKSNNVVVFL